MKITMVKISVQIITIIYLILSSGILYAYDLDSKKIKAVTKHIGANDALLVADHNGNIVLSQNADKLLTPASTFKLLTSLAAIRYLGTDYRFKTEFYTDNASDLIIKGFGDPLLVSELLPEICKLLQQSFGANLQINDIVLDNSFFSPVNVPGVLSSLNPYDATNGALCVNFNTVSFNKINNSYESAEPQTPLIPFAVERIKIRGAKNGRITFATEDSETTMYAGHLFRYFLEKQGFSIKGNIRLGTAKESDKLILNYASPFSLQDTIAKLLEYSNNFIANQIFLLIGASLYGHPATLEKGIAALSEYSKSVLNTDKIQIAEGSGIARENRISANNMLNILEKFKPYQHLMHREGRTIFKTGTLTGVSTLVGYIEDADGKQYSFVIFCNTPGRSAKSILAKLLKVI